MEGESNSMTDRFNEYGQPIGAPVPGWRDRDRPTRKDIVGRYGRLESVDPEGHAQDLYTSYQEAPDGRDWTYLFHERPESLSAFKQYLAHLASLQDALHFATVDSATGRAVGTAALMRIEPAHGVIEVGSITFSPPMKRSRVATEAMYLLMRLVFDDLGYRRYEWKCDSLNAPSIAAAHRLGFTYEGLFRRAIVYKGRNRDTAWFSIIEEEWPPIRRALESWLEPSNFDREGRQRLSLQTIRKSLAPS